MTLAQQILGANILIVDDQETNVQLLAEVLADAGYTNVSSTCDPAAVCSLHARKAYDLILLDLHMPVMDGFEVMEGLKVEAQGYLPVIVLSAQPDHVVRAMQAGAKDFLSKPFGLAEVRTRIHNMLEVRLLYRALEEHNKALEQAVLARTAQLRASEERYRSLTELASDWYWEQDEHGAFTSASGPAMDLLGIRDAAGVAGPVDALRGGWDEAERRTLLASIAARNPFLDFTIHRTLADGTRREFRVSGQPIFDHHCRFIGYRGIGVEMVRVV